MFVYHGDYNNSSPTGKKHIKDADIINTNNTFTKLTNDLGNGFYTFIDDDRDVDDKRLFQKASDNAVSFAKSYRSDRDKKVRLYKYKIGDSGYLILDFNDPRVQNVFIRNKIKFQEIINTQYQQIVSANSNNTHGFRKNLDGLLIEYLIKKNILPNADVIQKDTYTAFRKNTLSNFPNGREFVIRHPDKVILSQENVKVC
ncbi:hypothetical protein ABB39_08435 [Levilactobacillus brevis]|uniref:hypothetical protein n=1 Tax=Levilactobacillus brevis TaxID=1580 RepID=UPI0007601B30|nr:hypothetical protein [Levilactobacillus brevis]KWT47439.1 hypothetical protein ABB39_08435 [Levilactobacillus brevis]QWK86898.1 hypothetical protein KKI45_07780 [Levilactobacillus brevis]